MAHQDDLQKLESYVLNIVRIQGVHQMLLGSMLTLINQEAPDFKRRMIESLKQLNSADPRGHAMLDQALRLIAELPNSNSN